MDKCTSVKPKSVLVIDDDPLVCNLVQKIARELGAETTIIRNGETAFNLLSPPAAKQFDVVVLDLILPHKSGWDILSSIRANPLFTKTQVIIISGASLSDEEKSRVIARSGVVFIDKQEFTVDSFKKALAAAVGASDVLEDLRLSQAEENRAAAIMRNCGCSVA